MTPCLLFDFKHYDQSNALIARWTYTDAERPVVGVPGFAGITWTPETVQLGGIVHSQEQQSTTAEVRVPRNHPVAALFLQGNPVGRLWVSVHLYEAGTTSPVWLGQIKAPEWAGLSASLKTDSLKTRGDRKGLRIPFSSTCWKVLFSADAAGMPGSGCGVNRAAWTLTGTVLSVSPDGRTVTTDLSAADGHFALGFVRAAGQERVCLASTGGVLTLMSAISGLTAGAAIEATKGCNKSTDVTKGCKSFSNIARYGGCPHVPLDNPFERPLSAL